MQVTPNPRFQQIRELAIQFGDIYVAWMRKKATELTDGSSERQVATMDKIRDHFPTMLMNYTYQNDYRLMFNGFLLANSIDPNDMIPEIDFRQLWITNRMDVINERNAKA